MVTRPEYLPTVVALGGHLLIVADETGDAMIELKAIDSPRLYLIGPRREVIAVLEDPNFGGEAFACWVSSSGLAVGI